MEVEERLVLFRREESDTECSGPSLFQLFPGACAAVLFRAKNGQGFLLSAVDQGLSEIDVDDAPSCGQVLKPRRRSYAWCARASSAPVLP
eukprot:5165317-Pyramimonas_sp.AAC.1